MSRRISGSKSEDRSLKVNSVLLNRMSYGGPGQEGTKPEFDRDARRAKTKAARKARRNNR